MGKETRQHARYSQLVSAIASLNTQMVTRVATVANQALVLRNWIVGAYIVEFEQNGADRAKYGARLLETLAEDLASKSVNGLGVGVLGRCRQLFLAYPKIGDRIPSTLWTELAAPFRISSTVCTKSCQPIRQTVPDESGALADSATTGYGIRGTVSPESGARTNCTGYGVEKRRDHSLPVPFAAEQLLRLSWSHFLELIRIDDPWKRAFYENECLRGHWSVRQLQRQIESLLYERTGLSTNKKAVVARARKQEAKETVADVLRDPYILEFAGLAERPEYSEDQLETALLDHLQRFLLELGRGFCFEARQFRMTEGRKHHRLDLVFYHRLLRCHVLIDLKIRAFVPADAGQMNFYVNWFKANMMAKGDNPPVGILLCSDKDSAEVEFATAGMSQKLFVTRYLTALPSVQQLKAFLERDRAEIRALTTHQRGQP